MTDKVSINIIAEDDATKTFEKVGDSIDKLGDQVESSSKKMDEATDSDKKRVRGLADLKAGLDIAAKGIGLVKDFVEDSVKAFVDYAAQVRDLSRAIGANAEETSSLIQVADDVGVSVGTLEAGFKAAIKNGIQPNIANLSRLSDEYKAIKDPVARSQFAMEKFGRAGLEMGKLLEQGGDAIRGAADEARKMGLTLDDKAVKSARDFEIALDNMGDKLEALKLRIGKEVIPRLNEFFDTLDRGLGVADQLANGMNTLDETENRLGAVVARNVLIFGDQSIITKQSADALREYLLIRQQVAQTEQEKGLRANMAQIKTLNTMIPLTKEQTQGMQALAEANRIAAGATEENTTKMDRLKVIMGGEVVKEMESYNQEQETLRSRAAEITAELDKLNASQGRAITVQKESTLTEAELNLATQQLAKAQGDLAAATDPLKQAELAVKIEDLQGKIGGASGAVTSYIDNSKRIGELQTEYDGINKAIEANAAKHEEATKRILFGFAQQQLAADGLSAVEVEALNALAKDFGLIDEKTADAFDKTLKATQQLAEDQSIANFRTNMAGVYDDVSGKTETYNATVEGSRKKLEEMGIFVLSNTKPTVEDLGKTVETTGGHLDTMKKSVDNSNESLDVAAKRAVAFKTELDKLQDKTITVTVRYATKGTPPAGVGGNNKSPSTVPGRAQGGPVDEGLYYLHNDEYVLSRAMRYGREPIPQQAIPAMSGGPQRVTNNVNNFYDTLSTAMWLERQRQEDLDQIAAVM